MNRLRYLHRVRTCNGKGINFPRIWHTFVFLTGISLGMGSDIACLFMLVRGKYGG
jgi:hypothetical protein